MPVARRAAALPGSWDRSRSSSSWRAARGEIIPRTYSRALAAPPAAGGPGRRAREGRGPLEAGQVLWPCGACDPPRWLCAVLLRPPLSPASHPEARTKETRPGFPGFTTPDGPAPISRTALWSQGWKTLCSTPSTCPPSKCMLRVVWLIESLHCLWKGEGR